MFLHILTSPIFGDLQRWSHELHELPLLLPTYLVFLSPNAIYNIPLDDLFKQVMEVDQAMNKLWNTQHGKYVQMVTGHE
jgi:hypothetical protein